MNMEVWLRPATAHAVLVAVIQILQLRQAFVEGP